MRERSTDATSAPGSPTPELDKTDSAVQASLSLPATPVGKGVEHPFVSSKGRPPRPPSPVPRPPFPLSRVGSAGRRRPVSRRVVTTRSCVPLHSLYPRLRQHFLDPLRQNICFQHAR